MSTLLDTPLQQIGRLIGDVELRHASYDVGGSNVNAFASENRARLQNALHGARMGLYEAACDQRAETAADLVVQLSSAFIIVDCQAGNVGNEAIDENLNRVRAAIASALSVVLRSVDSLASVPLRSCAASSVGLVFDRKPRLVGGEA